MTPTPLNSLNLLATRPFRFALVGGFCAALSSALIFCGTDVLGQNYLLVTFITFLIANAVGHVLNRTYTFRANGAYHRSLLRYFVLATINLGLSLVLMAFLVEIVRIDPWLSSLVLSALFMVINFVTHSRWTFAPDG